MRYRVLLLVLAMSANWLQQPNSVYGGGFTPDVTSMAPGMVGVGDQGDAVEMGQRLGKFMGSFMREMKNPNEGVASDERSTRNSQREYRNYRDRDDPRDFESDPRRNRNEGEAQRRNSESLRFVPLYDPWGAEDRGNPLLDYDSWGGYNGSSRYGSYERSGPYERSEPYRDVGPYGWAADQNWNSGRGYYGAGLAPWERQELGPNPRSERRWRDPSYYDPDFNPKVSDPTDGAYGPLPWQATPRSGRNWRDDW